MGVEIGLLVIFLFILFFLLLFFTLYLASRVRGLTLELDEKDEDLKRLTNKLLTNVEDEFSRIDKKLKETMDLKDLAIREEMDKNRRTQSNALEEYDKTFEQFENRIKIVREKSERSIDTVQSVQENLQSLSKKIDLFEENLQKIYKSELKKSFKLFDYTVSSVLSEMKTELKRGVNRIEEIEEVVHGKEQLQKKLLSEEFSKQKVKGIEAPKLESNEEVNALKDSKNEKGSVLAGDEEE